MTLYAHIADSPPRPRQLPDNWTHAGGLVMGLSALSVPELAALGWYPVRWEALEPGASGYDDAYLDEQAGEFVIPSLPGDPAAALAAAKSQKHAERYAALLEARNGGFLFAGKVVESDQESRILITGAAQLAALATMAGTQQALDDFAASLGAGWRYADGTIAVTSAAGMIALGQALAIRIATCDAISQAYKAAIDASATVEAVAAIDVAAGYALE